MSSIFSEFNELEFSELDQALYRTIEESNVTLKNQGTGELSILYINIVSLPSNMDIFMNFLAKFDKKPHLICLSETKITEKSNTDFHPYLENYTFFHIKSITHFGGVGIFIRDELSFSQRDDLSCSELGLYETLWLNIADSRSNSTNTTVGLVYRHPGHATIPTFTCHMEILSGLNR